MPDPGVRRPGATTPSAAAGRHDFTALVRARVGPLPVDPLRESDIVDELARHVAEHYAELVASGVPDADAVVRALAPRDDRDQVARLKSARDSRPPARSQPPPPPSSGSSTGNVARDVRYAVSLL